MNGVYELAREREMGDGKSGSELGEEVIIEERGRSGSVGGSGCWVDKIGDPVPLKPQA